MSVINDNLEKAANILGLGRERLEELDEQTKENLSGAVQMFEINTKNEQMSAYKELERIWQEGQINLEISEFARLNYKDKTALLALPLQDKQRILFEWQMNIGTDFADMKVKEYHDSEYLKRLPEVAEFMDMPLEEFEKLSPGVRIQICMCYDTGLEYLEADEDMTEDDIRNDLKQYLNK